MCVSGLKTEPASGDQYCSIMDTVVREWTPQLAAALLTRSYLLCFEYLGALRGGAPVAQEQSNGHRSA